MRRIGPRKGTETIALLILLIGIVEDEKNRSPKGDGNVYHTIFIVSPPFDEKNRSPKGDGNPPTVKLSGNFLMMRRIGPRKGTETFWL